MAKHFDRIVNTELLCRLKDESTYCMLSKQTRKHMLHVSLQKSNGATICPKDRAERTDG